MSGRDGSPKITLALLKGRAVNQSVPSITYRFNPSADHLTQVSDPEEEEEDLSNECGSSSLEAGVGGGIARAESLRDASPVKDGLSRTLGKRSSSLDSSGGGPLVETPPPRASEGGLLSRITKTFEDKINEIRKDKEGRSGGERLVVSGEGSTESDGSDRSPTKDRKALEASQEERKTDVAGSPPKAKTSLVQDITEHTSKLKSEIVNIRPKLSELRNRRSSKEGVKGAGGREGAKGKTSVFTSLLGRDEGLGEEMLLECDEAEVDRAVEAHEDPAIFTEDLAGMDPCPTPGPPQAPPTHPVAPTTPQVSGTEGGANLRERVGEVVRDLPVTPAFLTKFCLVLFVLGLVLPLPSFLAGLLIGVLSSGLVCYCLLHFVLSPTPVPPPQDLGPVLLTTLPAYEDKQLVQGWMNELEGEYSPDTYHVSLTHSVLVRLQGSKLQLDHPRGKVPKHARLKEEIRNTVFTHHRDYDIAGCQVLLLPRNLPRRWLWSRKYPICIRLQIGSKESSPSPVSITSTPTGSAHGSPTHTAASLELGGRQGSSESGEGNWSLDNNKWSGEEDLLTSSLDMASFEEVTEDMCTEKSLYLFARTDREKDDWFRRLVAASELGGSSSSGGRGQQQSSPSHRASTSQDPSDSVLLEGIPEDPLTVPSTQDHQEGSSTPPEVSFERYMARLLYPPGPPVPDGSPGLANMAWFNALGGRLFYDFLHNAYWANKVQERVQRKLSKLHVPYFVGEVVVCGVNLGWATPQLCGVGTPHVDNRGLWVDLEVEYTGNFTMSLETKLDLMKLKRGAVGLEASTPTTSSPPSPGEATSHPGPRPYSRSPSSDRLLRNLHFDTDTDDSVESSSEEEWEEEGLGEAAPMGGGGPTSRRLLRLVDTVAGSRYFQQVSEWRLLQRAMQGVSNTRIELSVEVRRLAGTLALNVPPPPADRLWYGFRGTPELVMVARPRLGDRVLSLPILVEFIQKQLRLIFEKVFVLPNMDDVVIPIMSPLLPGQHTHPRPPWEAPHHTSTLSESPPRVPPTNPSTTPTVKFTPSPH